MTIQDNWPYDRVVPTEDGAVYDLLTVLETEYDRIDVELDELQEQRFIETATGTELDKLASEVGVVRETGESDERLRFRTKVAKAITRSSGNIYELVGLLELLFGDLVETITLTPVSDAPVINMNAPDVILNEAPVDLNTLEDLLTQALPSGDSLTIITDDTFAFGGDTSGAGFNEGTWA